MEEWKMASISARRAKEILPGEEEMPEKRKNSMKIVPRGTPCACAEWKASTAPEESRGEEESRRRQSKGTDHALRRLGSGEFASASSPHLASSITNISTGPCPSPPSLLSAPSSSFTSSTGDPRFTWSLWRSSTREHATLPTTLDALHALAFHALIRDIPMRLQSRETLATSIDEYRQFSNVLSRKNDFRWEYRRNGRILRITVRYFVSENSDELVGRTDKFRKSITKRSASNKAGFRMEDTICWIRRYRRSLSNDWHLTKLHFRSRMQDTISCTVRGIHRCRYE